jgi:hypothetical protein
LVPSVKRRELGSDGFVSDVDRLEERQREQQILVRGAVLRRDLQEVLVQARANDPFLGELVDRDALVCLTSITDSL